MASSLQQAPMVCAMRRRRNRSRPRAAMRFSSVELSKIAYSAVGGEKDGGRCDSCGGSTRRVSHALTGSSHRQQSQVSHKAVTGSHRQQSPGSHRQQSQAAVTRQSQGSHRQQSHAMESIVASEVACMHNNTHPGAPGLRARTAPQDGSTQSPHRWPCRPRQLRPCTIQAWGVRHQSARGAQG